MTGVMYPPATREIAQQRRALAPETQAAFDAFGRAAFAEGALPAKMKQIVSDDRHLAKRRRRNRRDTPADERRPGRPEPRRRPGPGRRLGTTRSHLTRK